MGCVGSVGSDQGGGGQSGTGSTPGGGGTGLTDPGTGGAPPVCVNPSGINPGPADVPLRRLTTFEYNKTLGDLLGDTSNPGNVFPGQVDSESNPFGNDAAEQAPSALLIEKYQSVAEAVAATATANTTALGNLHACARSLTASTEEACARMIATTVAPRAYRRATTTTDIDNLVALYKKTREIATSVTFGSAVAAMIEGMLQSPHFLYRIEYGTAVPGNANVKRITGREMAARLSYMFWQTMPDPPLFQAADMGMLDTKEGVLTQAKRLLEEHPTKSHPVVAFFFDNVLSLADLNALTRDAAQFPKYTSAMGVAMRNEVQRLVEYEIFENTMAVGPYVGGSWPALLTAPYTFVNASLVSYYGTSSFAAGASVTGTGLQKVNFNTDQRRGLLTLAGVMAGTTTSNHTNPVLRGSFVLNKLMCRNVRLPTGFTPPPIEMYTGKTARERVAKHTANPACAKCHLTIDPLGLPFENYDPIGLYRTTEHAEIDGMKYDTAIDASGSVPGVPGMAKNAVELVQLLASSEEVHNCFAGTWMQFAYGRSLDPEKDACNRQSLQTAFKASGYNVKQLLLGLTQTDAFLYRPVQ